MESPTKTAYMRGAIYGLAAVCIWGAFIVVSRLGVRLRRHLGRGPCVRQVAAYIGVSMAPGSSCRWTLVPYTLV